MGLSRQQKSIGFSLLFHAVLLTVLLCWYVPRRLSSSKSPELPGRVASRIDVNQSDDHPLPVPTPDDQNSAGEQPVVSAQEIQSSIDSQIEQVAKLSDEHKLTELEKNVRRLESMASDESVAQVSAMIAQSLTLDTDQYNRNRVPAEGEFDTNSAQMSDVLRTKDNRGNWRYETVMVDAAGREMRVPLGSIDGEKLYDTFELMKRYPMARGIYQSVVMPMIQKLLESESVGRSGEPTVIAPSSE